ncbi:hypothetical protein LguiB_028651 [Lonicera macranthoides]
MATTNPFDLLVDDDNDDPNQLLAKLPPAAKKSPAPPAQAEQAKPAAKLPSKPLPPAQAVREGKTDGPRGGGRFGGRGTGRGRGGGRGFNRDSDNNETTFGGNNGYSGRYRPEDGGDAEKFSERRGGYSGPPRGGYRGGRRGGYSNGNAADGERPRRVFERRSGTGRGNEVKREGAGRGNWGTPNDEIAPETEEPVTETEKDAEAEKQVAQEEVGDANKKDNAANEPEEKEPEDKEMTLEEYEKVLEEKRKALLALKSEERKVALDKELQSMQLLSNKKKNDDEIFIKLGSEKDKRKEAAEKEEKAKKSLSINEFLKPAEGESYYGPSSRGGRGGRGRGRGSRGGYGGGLSNNVEGARIPSIAIEDVGQFPSLGGK